MKKWFLKSGFNHFWPVRYMINNLLGCFGLYKECFLLSRSLEWSLWSFSRQPKKVQSLILVTDVLSCHKIYKNGPLNDIILSEYQYVCPYSTHIQSNSYPKPENKSNNWQFHHLFINLIPKNKWPFYFVLLILCSDQKWKYWRPLQHLRPQSTGELWGAVFVQFHRIWRNYKFGRWCKLFC